MFFNKAQMVHLDFGIEGPLFQNSGRRDMSERHLLKLLTDDQPS